MKHATWTTIDRWMRTLHLYSGLFLVPWMIVYATSAFCLNHGKAITGLLNVAPPHWETIEKTDFSPDGHFPKIPAEQASVILQHLELDGPHRVLGKPDAPVLTILRISGSGNYRIKWLRQQRSLVVEKQTPFSTYRLVHYLHFRCSYNQPYIAFQAWAMIVDLVAFCIGLWVVSGVYIWARRPRKRLLGGLFLAAGFGLFTGLVILLCM